MNQIKFLNSNAFDGFGTEEHAYAIEMQFSCNLNDDYSIEMDILFEMHCEEKVTEHSESLG